MEFVAHTVGTVLNRGSRYCTFQLGVLDVKSAMAANGIGTPHFLPFSPHKLQGS